MMRVLILGMALLTTWAQASQAQDFVPPPPGPRDLVVISDLHQGQGCREGRACDPREDFLWPAALAGLLEKVRADARNPVDLLIAGDMLELWQPPPGLDCAPAEAELGCTADQTRRIAEGVVRAHADAFAALATFAEHGENRLWVVPGNHDAALLLDSVWEVVGEALRAGGGRVARVASGVWSSPDGRVVVEHGHQIGRDANRYRDWPAITRADAEGRTRLVRTWGERFVQRLFNRVEPEYPIIDNLSPETAGARYRMAAEGRLGTAADAARFIAFNLFETSVRQKLQILGRPRAGGGPREWDMATARGLGEQLFLLALAGDDPFRAQAEDPAAPEAAAVRAELARLAADPEALPDADVLSLCDQVAARTGQPACARVELGSGAEALLASRDRVVKAHLAQRRREFPRMQTFVYGHTHQLEPAHCVELDGLSRVDVLNSGAFQRVMDERDYEARLAQRTDVAPGADRDVRGGEGLRRLTLREDFKPCYTVVLAPFADGRHRARTWRWVMAEDEAAGRLVPPGDPACHWAPPPPDAAASPCPR